MVLCKFYQEGRCNRGASCSFEHVTPNQAWRGGQTKANTTTEKYNETSIKLSLKDERPPWQLSVFGPAKEEPNMIVGTDRSPEEDRMLYYMAMRQTGNINPYIQSHENALQEVNKQVNAILGSTRAAIQHYEKEKSNSNTSVFGASDPNKEFAPFLGNNAGGAFGGSSSSSSSSSFGLKPSIFGNPTPSAFGGSSNSTMSKPAFGQSSAFGGTAPAFGQQASAFGQPSAFGQQPSAVGSTFGQPSALGGGSAFGKPSSAIFGGGSAFGQTSALGGGVAAPAFGQPSALGGGGSIFGQQQQQPPSALSSGGGGATFGSTSALGTSSNAAAPAFGTTPAFGALATTTTTTIAPAFGGGGAAPFGSSNAFGNPQAVDVSDPKFAPFKQDHFEYKLIPEIEPPIGLR